MRIISKILIIVLIPSALSLVIHFSNINREILAKNKTEINIQTSVNSENEFENEIEDENEDEDEDENEENDENQNSVSINTKSNTSAKNSVKIENNKFEIEGAVDSLSANSFTVNGQSVSIDTGLVNTYRQKGILKVGNEVKVKGTVKNSILYAEDVKIMNGVLGNFKVEVKSNNKGTVTAATVTPNPSISAGPTPSGNATVSANADVKIKANGPVDQVILFINQILNFLKTLV